MLSKSGDFGDFKQLLEGQTLHGFAETFAVLAFFHPPIPNLFNDFFDFGVRSFNRDEGNEQGAHLSAVNDRGLGSAEDGRAAFVADVQGAGHGVDTVHTTHAFGVVDEEAAAVPFHALGGAQVDDFGFDVELAPVTTGVSTGVGGEFAGNVGFHSFLIDLDVVLPRTHDGKVGTGHSGHAAVRAAVELELELVGEGGTVQLVLIVHGELIASVLRVVAGVFAAALAKAGGRRTEVRTGTAEVDVKLVGEIVEDLFKLRGLGADEHDVAGGTVHVGQTGATEFPNVAQAAQEFGGVVLAGGLSHADGVEVSHAGEHFGLVAVTADNAAAVTEHAHDAAVLPVRFPFFIGEFKHAEQVVGSVGGNLKFHVVGVGRSVFSFLLDVGHEAGPGASFELIQQGSWMFDCHCLTSTWFGW